ncbi:MAG: cyclase family protein [Candidatus Tectomicrobia bacterium]|uniref:Kynurenine formamidase n=1 Tax=Tectimicrobiota bacterium TaxID=2528274 RepID=A0A932ZUG0_UNCTE|nr:cyclase family protein [Candidatus Tectomicrobia bacterium]
MRLIDLTIPIREGMPVWPGDPAPRLRFHKSFAAGDRNNVSESVLGLHTGTHLDAPMHFLPEAGGIETLPLDVLVGPARVIPIEHPRQVTAEELRRRGLAGATRFLIRTRNSAERWWEKPFDPGFCHMTREAAQLLLDAGMRLLGVDCLSVDGKGAPGSPVHNLLLPAGVVLLEGLDLSQAPPGDYELIALPALFWGRDGAPARAVLRTSQPASSG